MPLRTAIPDLGLFIIAIVVPKTLFKTIKSELIWPVVCRPREDAEHAVARYVDGFYNPVRRHSSLGFQSPIAVERKARKVSQTLSTQTGQIQSSTYIYL